MPVGIINFNQSMEVLSSAILNGGDSVTTAVFIMQVPYDYDNPNPKLHASHVRDALGLPKDSVGMMTAAEIDYVFNTKEIEFNGAIAKAVVTAGLGNHIVAGDVLSDWNKHYKKSLERSRKMMIGTINIIIISSVPLTMEGKVNIAISITEAKTAAMNDVGFKETGTTSDSIAIVSPAGTHRESYSGTGSPIGTAASMAVRSAVRRALNIRNEHPIPNNPMDVISKMGYSLDDMYMMSNTKLSSDIYKMRLRNYMLNPRTMIAIDILSYISDHVDSLVNDNNKTVIEIIFDICHALIGFTPSRFDGTMRVIIRSIAEYVGGHTYE